MATKKKFEAKQLYQGSAQSLPSYGERYFEVPDITPALRQNRESLIADYKMTAEQGLNNLQLEYQRDKVIYDHNDRVNELIDNNNLNNLKIFSQSLSDILTTGAKIYQERSEADVMAQEVRNSIITNDLQNIDDNIFNTFKEQEIALSSVVGDLQSSGAPTSSVHSVIEQSGTKLVNHSKYRLLKDSTKFSLMWQEAIQADVTLSEDMAQQFEQTYPHLKHLFRNSDGSPITINLSNLGELENTSATSTLIAVARQHHLSNILKPYAGTSRMMMNKYFYPAIRKHLAHDELITSQKAAEALKNEFLEESTSAVNVGIKNGIGGEEFEQQFAVLSRRLGSTVLAKEALQGDFYKRVKAGEYTDGEIEIFLDQKITRNDGKEITIGDLWEKDFEVDDFDQMRSDGREALIAAQKEDKKAADAELTLMLNNYEAENEEPMTIATAQKIAEEHRQKFPDYYSNIETPEPILNFLTRQQLGQHEEWVERLNLKHAREGITEQDLENAPAAVVKHFEDKVIPNKNSPEENNVESQLKELSTSFARERFNVEGDNFGSAGTQFRQRVERDLRKTFSQMMASHDNAPDAVEAASKIIKSRIDSGMYLSYDTSSDQRARNVKASAFVQGRIDSGNGRTALNTLIPDSENEIKELSDWVANKGKGELPETYQHIARMFKTNPWDVANSQYHAATGKELPKPSIIQKLEKEDIVTQRLFNNKPGGSATGRLAEKGIVPVDPGLISNIVNRNYTWLGGSTIDWTNVTEIDYEAMTILGGRK